MKKIIFILLLIPALFFAQRGEEEFLVSQEQLANEVDICDPFVNANSEEYTNSNAFAKTNNANATTGLDVFGGATQASVAETGGCTTYVWQITGDFQSTSRGREVLVVSNGTGTYQYEYWARGIGTDSSGWRASGWLGVATSPNQQFTDQWVKYSGTFTATSVNPTLHFYTNRSAAGGVVGSAGDIVQVTGFIIKLL